MTLLLSSNFTLARFRFTLEALDLLHLQPYKGNPLRGGFGHVMKRLACTHLGRCGQQCSLGNDCAYGYAALSLSDLPPDRRTHTMPGHTLDFTLVLVGRGITFLPHFVTTFVKLVSFQFVFSSLGKENFTMKGMKLMKKCFKNPS